MVSYVALLVQIAVIIALAWVISRILIWALIKVSKRAGVSPDQFVSIKKWVRVVTFSLAAVGIINVVGLGSRLELLTLSGMAALIVTLALQGFVSNVLSSVLAFKDDTLRLGDVVDVASGGCKGRVVKVGLRNVWIKTDSGALIVIGNSTLENGRYWNYTAAERLQKKFETKA